jgi:hypothetical protein
LFTKDDLLLVGHAADGDVYISQEQRESHLHIVGTVGEGKSKFLEYLIRRDIDRLVEEEAQGISPRDGRACGLCFIDPSAQGGTINKILKYCAEIGFYKVLLIDPYSLKTHGKIAPINPFNYDNSHINDSVASLMDAFRVLFDVREPGRAAILESNLPALMSLLHHGKFTLYDSMYFTNYDDPSDLRHREFIFDKLKDNQYVRKDLNDIWSAFKNEHRFKEFGSTVRRLNPIFRSDALKFMLAHHHGVDFTKLISNGWVILVNASTDEGLDVLQSRLLATIVINQILSAIERMRRSGFNKPYYIYLDEAGEYATRKVARTLELKRQIGIRFILSHQHLGQLEDDPRIKRAVVSNTKLKAAFYIEDADERHKVTKMLGYGGELKPEDVAYALSMSQKKRQMVFRLDRLAPVIVQVPDTPDAGGNVKEYLNKLFASPWYYTPEEILKDNADRFKGMDTVRSERATKPNNRTNSGSSGRQVRHGTKGAQKDGGQKASNPQTPADADMAWEDAFLGDEGNKGKAD